ncbi:HAD family hydrolase [Pedobacter chitinilyticus]|uniref:HAD family hydrolase n=1 Tax=Pedobacter chitinilyticus TaxID=2233776 RepID=A0A443YPQ2_9SPHI|nr:HAD-IA family hydrolase [Pedobacter chitinilyticus]RWU05737.1 HAD family hydrolase [Pedobacter chitinilyticus]
MDSKHLEKLELLTKRTEGEYQAFLYDCDGTLADNMMAHKLAYKEVAANYGVGLDLNMVDEFAGMPTAIFAGEITKRYGVSLPDTFASEKSQIFIDKYIEQTQPISYVAEHLKNHVGKVKIAVVSGGSRKTVTKTLTVLGLIDLVDVLVCAGETPKGKPAPDPFLAAAQALGVEPKKCIVFEDAELGVQGAIAAGMDWVRIDQI